jgi:hypothetical protein
VLLVRWVDRLGRNYQDVRDAIREFIRRGVVIALSSTIYTFDGTIKDPLQQAVRDALIGFMAASAQTQVEATKAAQRARIAQARANDGHAHLGRKPSYTREQFDAVRTMLGNQAVCITQVAKDTGLTRQSVSRMPPGRRGGGFGCMGPAAFSPDNADTGNSGVDPDPQSTLAESPSKAGRCIPPEYRRSGSPFRPCKLSAVRVRIYGGLG